jgi:predicted AlkP superfamily phosphohydrolase/phosphomutase
MARGVLAAVKKRTPSAVKGVYNRRVPIRTRLRVAQPTTSPALDWARTRAFAVPADQHGLVRINLRGREAEGVVSPSDYRRTCDELAATLSELRTVDGRPVVEDVVNGDPSGEPHHLLPDLVVHWADAAFDRVVRLRAPAIEVSPIVPELTGQHRPNGFCVARGVAVPSSIDAADLIACLTSAAGL